MSTSDPRSPSPEASTPPGKSATVSQQDVTAEIFPESGPSPADGSIPGAVESPSTPADESPDTPSEPPPSYVKLAMRNMVRKGGKSLFHFSLTVTALMGLLVGLAYLTR